MSSLTDACRTGEYDEVKALIDSNMDVNTRDSSGANPILTACQYGHHDIVQLLLESKSRRSCTIS